jgi:prefoldin subunit 5|tara:strand:- start:73 stop:351 length:279 start_codon:yes stop_codon:yes gene_type:complete
MDTEHFSTLLNERVNLLESKKAEIQREIDALQAGVKRAENALNFLDKMEGKTDAEQEEVLDALGDKIMAAIESGKLQPPPMPIIIAKDEQKH